MSNISENVRHERLPQPDILRGIAILLVVFGHGIQYFSHGNIATFEDPNFSYVYSFHMPLFMAIGGWLFARSISAKKMKTALCNILQRITVPHIVWSVIIAVSICLLHNNLSLQSTVSSTKAIFENLWFVWVLAIFEFGFLVLDKLLKGKTFLVAAGILFAILAVLPFDALNMYVWLYPYFLCGFLVNRYPAFFGKVYRKYRFLFVLAFPILVVNWSSSFLVYDSGSNLWSGMNSVPQQLFYNTWRLLAGFAGCVSLYFVASEAIANHFLPWLGKQFALWGQASLSIYFLQTIFVEHYLGEVVPDLTGSRFLFEFGLCLCMAVALVYVFTGIHFLLKKWKVTRFLFLGGR